MLAGCRSVFFRIFGAILPCTGEHLRPAENLIRKAIRAYHDRPQTADEVFNETPNMAGPWPALARPTALPAMGIHRDRLAAGGVRGTHIRIKGDFIGETGGNRVGD